MASKKEKKEVVSGNPEIIKIIKGLEESKKDWELKSFLDKIDNQIAYYKKLL